MPPWATRNAATERADKYAEQNQFKHHLGVTYIATDEESIFGFATFSATSIEITELPDRLAKSLPNYPLPALRIARLASSLESRGMGIGKLLLRAAFELALRMADEVGCVGVVVDAKEPAVPFCERYGFEQIEALEGESNARPVPTLMFLPLGSVPRRP